MTDGPPCCDDPQPAVLTKNGRQFCRSCRKYLDVKTADPTAIPAVELQTDHRRKKKGSA